MNSDKQKLSFGRYLRGVRIEKGVSLEEIFWKTKIGIDNLLLIEKEDHDQLPAEVYVKGFLRSYAKAVGANSDEVVGSYLLSLHNFKETLRSETDFKRAGKVFWPRLLLSLGTLMGIMVLSVYVIHISLDQTPDDNHHERQVIEDNTQDVHHKSFQRGDESDEIKQQEVVAPSDEVASVSLQPTSSDVKQAENISERLLLKILAIEETWVKVIMDNQSPKEYSLHPGDRLEFEASFGYNLLIGNAGGIKLILDDNPIDVPGKSGQVVNIQIP